MVPFQRTFRLDHCRSKLYNMSSTRKSSKNNKKHQTNKKTQRSQTPRISKDSRYTASCVHGNSRGPRLVHRNLVSNGKQRSPVIRSAIVKFLRDLRIRIVNAITYHPSPGRRIFVLIPQFRDSPGALMESYDDIILRFAVTPFPNRR